MSIIGMLTHPIHFEEHFYAYPPKEYLQVGYSFEGANHILCRTLDINPIVLRMVCVDKPAIRAVAGIMKEYDTAIELLLMLFATLDADRTYSLMITELLKQYSVKQ